MSSEELNFKSKKRKVEEDKRQRKNKEYEEIQRKRHFDHSYAQHSQFSGSNFIQKSKRKRSAIDQLKKNNVFHTEIYYGQKTSIIRL